MAWIFRRLSRIGRIGESPFVLPLCSSSPTLKVPTAALLHLQVMSLLAGFRLHGFEERTVQSPPVIHAIHLSRYASIETHITSYTVYVLSSICAWERVQRVVSLGSLYFSFPISNHVYRKRMEMVGHRLCHTITIPRKTA